MGEGDAGVVQGPRAQGLFRREKRRVDVRLAGGPGSGGGGPVHGWPAAGSNREFSPGRFFRGPPGRLGSHRAHQDMEQDGVSAEVLYPSLGLGLYCIEDAEFQEALFRTYNDWLIDYCQKVPDRLYGIALISMYNIEHAITEMERCKKQGVVGTMIWQVPDPKLPFTSEHYERFWAASQDLELPIHLAYFDRLWRQHEAPDKSWH